MNRFSHIMLCAFVVLLGLPGMVGGAEKVADDVLFARKVLPLFKAKCIVCHGEDSKKKLKGDFDMRSRAGLLKGGESEEPSVVPGKPLQSPLYLAVTRMHEDDWESMPPKENDKLSAEEITYICLLYTSPSPRDQRGSRMPSSA